MIGSLNNLMGDVSAMHEELAEKLDKIIDLLEVLVEQNNE